MLLVSRFLHRTREDGSESLVKREESQLCQRHTTQHNVGIMVHVFSLMATHIQVSLELIKGNSHCNRLLRGNRVMVHKNRMVGQRITYQNQENKERDWFKLYTLFTLVQVAYIRRYTT